MREGLRERKFYIHPGGKMGMAGRIGRELRAQITVAFVRALAGAGGALHTDWKIRFRGRDSHSGKTTPYSHHVETSP